MDEFGDNLGTDIIFHNNHIYISSLDKILIFDTNLKLQHTLKVQQKIKNLHVDDLQIYALTDDLLLIFGQDRTLIKKVKLQVQSPVWKKDLIYFYSNKRQAFCTFDNKIELIQEYERKSDSIMIQLLLNKYIVFIDDNQLIIIDEGINVLKQMPRKFTTISVHDNYIATSDESGRLIVFKYEQKKAVIILQEHWHAHPINCIIIQNESIFTAGKEGVVVQWHLGTGRKAFFPRQGAEIISMTLKDEIFVGLSNNRVQKVPLNGSPTQQYWQGIQNNQKYQNYQSFDGKIIANGASGQLQVLNGQFIKNIDILQQNYVSEVGSQIKDQLDISKFLFIEQYLFCAVSSQNIFQQIFLENVDNNYVQTTSVNYQEQIYGFDTLKSDQLILLTYGKHNIRMWKKITSERGNKIWTCIFNQQQINEVRYAKLQSDKGSISLLIIFDQSLIVFHPQTNSIRNQIVFQKQLVEDSKIIVQNNILTYTIPNNNNGTISMIDLKTQKQKILTVKFQTFSHIFDVSDKQIAIVTSIDKIADQHVILVDTLKQQINKIIQLNGNYDRVFLHLQHNVNYLIGLNQCQYKVLYQFESERKSSYIQEMEVETQQEEKLQDIQPIIEVTKISNDNNALKRYVLSEQQRQLKNINLQDYFINQSHLLPSLKFVTKRIQDVLKCEIDPQVHDFKVQDKVVESDIPQFVPNKKLELSDMKRLFLTN